jgi:hypothetical protein
VFACTTSASCFSTSLTDGGALIDSSLLFGFIEILDSLLTLTASSTILIKFVWGWTGFTGLEVPDRGRRCELALGVWIPEVERLLWTGAGVPSRFGIVGADEILATDAARELLRDRDVVWVGRGR